ncbi:MAG: phosphoethanolamine transferase [Flavobacteriaceae bacterium]|nr:phosphoethanolamine transferase [Flavobacteriaceae bacterium]
MNKKPIIIFLIFFLPITVFFLFEIFFKTISIDRFYNLAENILFAIILIFISLVFKKEKFKNIYLKTAFIIFIISLYLETIYYYHFESIFSSSAVFVILETNALEAKEFLSTYINTTTSLLFLLLVLLIFVGIKAINKNVTIIFLNKFEKIKFALLFFSILIFLKVTKLIVFNVPYLAVKTPIVYYQEIQKFKNFDKEGSLVNFTNVKRIVKIEDKELYVIVIGESTNKLHFQLNGEYYRETTPLLNEIENEIVALKNVISPHAYTIGSLTKGLTLGNVENPDGKYQGSIIQLLNQAGFKTYWVSNQRPIGISDTHVTKIARGVNKIIFLNIKHTSEKTPFDEELITELNKIVLEDGEKKVVFLHMMGAHLNYKKRYPTGFDYFKDNPLTKFKRKKVFEIINAYDNVMLYTDYVLREIIETVRINDVNSYVLYFSDHGQEVYDEIDFLGQTIDQMVTKNMYEIPMFLWMSNNFKDNKQIALNLDKKYMNDDLIHTIADLCNISSNEIDSTRSIFNHSFKERKRIIKENIDFDTYFKTINN